MDLQLRILLQFSAVELWCAKSRNGCNWSLWPESIPKERIRAYIVHLINQKLHVKLLKTGKSEQLFLFGCFEIRISESFEDLFFEGLSIYKNYTSTVQFDQSGLANGSQSEMAVALHLHTLSLSSHLFSQHYLQSSFKHETQ